jgi:hypothetical protein
LQDPSFQVRAAKPLQRHALDPKLSCSLQDPGCGPADPAAVVVADYPRRLQDASAGIAWNIADAPRATSFDCRERPARRAHRGGPSAGDTRFSDAADIPVCYKRFASDSSWKVGRSADNDGNDGSATFVVSDLLRVRLKQRSEQSKTAGPQNIETSIEFLPRLRRWGWDHWLRR